MSNTKPMKNGYTQNAWEGNNYDSNLDIKEIAKIIRTAFKKEYPKNKLSVRIQRFSGGQSIDIVLTEVEKTPFATPDINKCNDHCWSTPEEKLESWKNTIEKGQYQIHKHREDDPYFNEYGNKMFSFLQKIIDSYNFDDSDCQIDYFYTNFYSHLDIGSWNKPLIIKQ